MRTIDINNWNRKQHFEHFSSFDDPYFAVVVPLDVTLAYSNAKIEGVGFFAKYLHACMKAINEIENFRYRIIDEEIVVYDVIHASATILRDDKTFGCSFIKFDDDIKVFSNNVLIEKQRIQNSTDLFPPINGIDCIYCSAMPWVNFSGHKEPFSGEKVSVPMLAFSKSEKINDKLMMNVSISVNHALIDGYHVGLFIEHFQKYLNA